jgi:hypothetical protein
LFEELKKSLESKLKELAEAAKNAESADPEAP